MKESTEIRAVEALRAYFAHMSAKEWAEMVTKCENRRRLEKAVDVMECVGVAVSFGVLFYVWVILMACM